MGLSDPVRKAIAAGAILWLAGCAGTEPRPTAAAPPPGLPSIVAGRADAGPELAGAVTLRAGPRGTGRAEAAGRADIAAGRPMTADTPVRVASISKLAVAVAAMRLADEGVLDLDADVSAHLGFPLRHPGFPDRPVTLRQLLGHRSGLSDAGGYSFPLGATLAASLPAASWGPAPPGARFDYANMNYGVVATVMEAASRERFDRLMERLVIAPLKLEACFNWSGCSPAMAARAAVLYRRGRDETQWNPAGPWVAQVDAPGARPPAGCPVRLSDPDAPCNLARYRPGTNGTLFSPQGGLRISAPGLARIGRMLANGGALDGVRVLRPATAARFFKSAPVGPDAGETYGGLMREWGLIQCMPAGQFGPRRWCGHLGEAYGLYAGLWIDPVRRDVIVYALTGSADDPNRWPRHPSGLTGVEAALFGHALR